MENTILKCLVTFTALSICISCQNPSYKRSHLKESISIADYSASVNTQFDVLFEQEIARFPEWQTYLGQKENYEKWNNISQHYIAQTHLLYKKHLEALEAIDSNQLDEATQLSLTLYKIRLNQLIKAYQWRHHTYPVNQMFGVHTGIPSLLINQHRVVSAQDANDYIKRLETVPGYINQLINNMEISARKGVIPPTFVFSHVIRDSENIIKGLEDNVHTVNKNPLIQDFIKKINTLNLDDQQKEILTKQVHQALTKYFKPAYLKLISYLHKLEKRSDKRDGVWKLPNGEAFYKYKLESTTTTPLSAEDIHDIGLKEVDRIHREMRLIKDKVNFNGNLKSFFDFMREDKQFYFSNDEQGKQAYLEENQRLIDKMQKSLDRLFITKPKAKLIVKPVEAFREKSAGKAFYQPPAPDGSRPGIYYINLYDMNNVPSYQMEALAYHEALLGHHMQLSIAQEIENMPKFRRFDGHTAYIEGWGLYSELIPKEIGFYQSHHSDFGRLAMELWRACRLVVDTGIHAKKWTREQAINYLINNTPNSESDATRAIERYIVLPSQATAYKIGMLKILQLRQYAKASLGDNFDIRLFHDQILKNGSLPLDVLEELIFNWVEKEKGKTSYLTH